MSLSEGFTMPLFILRHGKAEHHAPSGHEYDRRLEETGRAQAQYIARLLKNPPAPITAKPTIILTSSAERAKATAAIIAEALGITPEIEERLSLQADLSDHFDLIKERYSRNASPGLMLVGHNPTLDELVASLIGSAAAESLRTGELVVVRVAPANLRESALLGRFRFHAHAD